MNFGNVLVTGCCGTVGKELVKQLMLGGHYTADRVIGVDQNESEVFFIDQEYVNEPRASFYLANLRDEEALNSHMQNIDVVFHTAALKHVVLCERSPMEAVQSNILGLQNLVAAAIKNKVKKVIFTSSDKAVNPTSVMGTSKLMGERLITAANNSVQDGGTIFSSTRFGNVLGSNGSVIPIFKRQLSQGLPITITDEGMTRFVMTLKEACLLVLETAKISVGGEVFITKMPTIRITDLAQAMINLMAPAYGFKPDEVKIDYIGSKPGEKLYEELMSDEETRRAIELEKYFVVLPAFRSLYRDQHYDYPDLISDKVSNSYISQSETAMSIDALQRYLIDNNLLNELPANEYPYRYWPGDKEDKQSSQ